MGFYLGRGGWGEVGPKRRGQSWEALGKKALGRGASKCKGPEVGMSLGVLKQLPRGYLWLEQNILRGSGE